MHAKETAWFLFLPISFFLVILPGCGGIQTNFSSALFATPGTLSFGDVAVGQTATANISFQNHGLTAIQVAQINTSDQAFSVLGQTVPATVAPGASYTVSVKFNPRSAGSASGQLNLVTNQAGNPNTSIAVNGNGTPGIEALSCNLTSISGSGADACTITLNVPAPSAGFAVKLSSSLNAVSLPSSVTVPANATAVRFNATISAVSSAQSVILTASAGGSSSSVALQLLANGSALSFNSSTISFGSTTLNTPVTQTVTASATGTLPITITSATLSGTGFNFVGGTFPITLNPGQSVALNIQFTPKALGAATGMLNVTSTGLATSTATIALKGTGVAHEVQLSWNAPANTTNPISGYSIFRAVGGSSTYQLLNSAVESGTSYIDTTVQGGSVYDYVVRSVDSGGAVSAPSNMTTVAIP